MFQAIEFEQNVFMYDSDGTSSYVTSNVLRLDVKAKDIRVTPGYMTFEQSISTPTSMLITPMALVDEDDASEFVYHRFVYGKETDNVCLIVSPIGSHTFTEYEVYFRTTEPPSITEYSFKVTVKQEDNWQTCIGPKQMNKHSGLSYYAVHVPENGNILKN